jgi:hypothetical protein
VASHVAGWPPAAQVATRQECSTLLHTCTGRVGRQMSLDQQFVFDTAGYIVIKGALSASEVDAINASIDHHLPRLRPTPSSPMSGRNPLMIGDRNLHLMVAEYLNDQRPGSGLGALDLMDLLLEGGFPASSPPPFGSVEAGIESEVRAAAAAGNATNAAHADPNGNIGPDEEAARRVAVAEQLQTRYSKDTFAAALGRVTLPVGGPLTANETAAIMDMLSTWSIDDAEEGDVVRMGSTRTDMHGMLSWDKPYCEPFRKLLVNHKVTPFLTEILGPGYRMDHMPHVSIAKNGADGHNLHGGAAQRYKQGGFLEGYQFHAGQIYAGMVVCEFVLADEGPDDGGLVRHRRRNAPAAWLCVGVGVVCLPVGPLIAGTDLCPGSRARQPQGQPRHSELDGRLPPPGDGGVAHPAMHACTAQFDGICAPCVS